MMEETPTNQEPLSEIECLNRELKSLKEENANLESLLEITSEHADVVEAELQKAKERAEQAQYEAEIANRAKSTFLANMSHELRTPLNGILGYANILLYDRSLTDRQKQGINIIQQSGEHLLTLINDILDLSKIEAGKLELVKNDFYFPGFLQGIVDLFRLRAEEKDIVFIYEENSPQGKLPIGIHGDEKKLRQILLNLLSNAMKFTVRDHVIFSVTYQSTFSLYNPQKGKLSFKIQDTGIGIAPDDIEKIFEPFRQVGEQNQPIEGTGLGLPISKKLVEMMGGQLKVTSELGKGSIFQFEIVVPILLNLGNSKNDLSSLTIIGFKDKGERKKGIEEPAPFRILVADDHLQNRSLLVDLLEPLGFDLLEAKDGQEVLLKVNESQPNVVLIDSMMSAMNCFDCVQKIRQMPQLKETVIIAVSANVFPQHQQECEKAGCDAFLPKPIDIEKLLELLARYLSLEWIYEPSENRPQSQNEEILKLPTEEELYVLLDLVRMGDIEGIIKYVTKLEQRDAQLQPFHHKVCQFAKQFEEQKLEEFLQPYLNNC
jgi:signal transduction histidine kinase/CheY-like chemotaxis protein